MLARCFLDAAAAAHRRGPVEIAERAEGWLRGPAPARQPAQLKGTIERAVLVLDGDRLEAGSRRPLRLEARSARDPPVSPPGAWGTMTLDEIERP